MYMWLIQTTDSLLERQSQLPQQGQADLKFLSLHTSGIIDMGRQETAVEIAVEIVISTN